MADEHEFLQRALTVVEGFSDRAVAVLPEAPSEEMLRYVAHVTGDDPERLRRIYQLFLETGRLDAFQRPGAPAAGFAED